LDEPMIIELAEEIYSKSGLVVDRFYHLRSYKNVVVGSELVKWLLEKKKADSIEAAVDIGQKFIKYKQFHHVTNEYNFKNERLFYRFYRDESSITADTNMSAISNAAHCTLSGYLTKKGKIKWNERFFVLQAQQKLLYYYDNEKSQKPRQVLDLSTNQIDVNECGLCNPGSYCFNVVTKDNIHTICAKKSAYQEEWINALVNTGCSWVEDASLSNIKSSSIFDFTLLDIDKQEFNLDQLKGKVCLVVNVASF